MSGNWASQVPGGAPFSAAPSPSGPTRSGSGDPLDTASPQNTVRTPSSLPILLAVGALAVSALLALATAPEATIGRIPLIGGLASLAASGAGESLSSRPVVASVLGYLLTPFAVVGALAWARKSGLENLDDPWFDRFKLRGQMRRLQSLTLLAFLVAVPHVVIIARAIQASIGLGR